MTQNIPVTHDPLRYLTRRLLGQLGQASRDHALVEPGDHVMVAISGGKDSYTLLDLLRQVQARAPFDFTFIAVNIDQGHPGYPRHVLEDYLVREGYRARDHQRGHLLDRQGEGARGQDVLLAVLAAATRHPVHRGASSWAAPRSRSAITATT